MKTSWTCPTCGTEKGDCESAHGTPPRSEWPERVSASLLVTDEELVEMALRGEVPCDSSVVHHAIRRLLQKDQRENAA